MMPTNSIARLSIAGTAASCVCALLMLTANLSSAADPAPGDKKNDKQGEPSKQKSSQPGLDDALLKDLDNELLEGAGDLAKPKMTPEKPDNQKPAEQPVEGEDVGAPSEERDPLTYISQQMRSVESLITKMSKRDHAEVLQRRIVEDLAKLIDDAEKQAQQQSAAKSAKQSQETAERQKMRQSKPGGDPQGKESNKPAKDSTDRLGKAEDARPDPQMIKNLYKDAWGHLPPRAREQMMQNSPEQFLPQYELMIERYYKRLAEEGSSK